MRFLFAIFLLGYIIMLAASCKTSLSEPPLFKLLPSTQTNIHFVNRISDGDKPGILDYLYYYNGGGVAVGDLNNDGLPDLFFTSNQKGGNKLYLNKGKYRFEDITPKAGVAGTADWSTGVTMADVNNDGWLDIYVCAVAGKLNLHGQNQLYINNHNGTFTESAAQYGLNFSGYSTQAVFFDYDHDGDLDCYLLNQSNHSVETYGDTSLRKKTNLLAGSRLYRNDKGHFAEVTAKAGIYSSALGYGLGVAAGDLNNDGWEDLYIGNDFHENDYYYINNHDGTFTESGAKHFNHYSRFSMGNDMADFNNDGQLDVVTADMLPAEENVLKTYGGDESYDQYQFKIVNGGFQYQYSRNCLQKNLGNGQAFSEVGLMDGVAATDWTWSPLLADFDNDGIKDLFFANGIKRRPTDMDYVSFISDLSVQASLSAGHQSDSLVLDKMPAGNIHPYVYQGTAQEKFTDKSDAWGMRDAMLSNGATYADLNNDGHLDLITNNINHEACIYQNTSAKTSTLSLQFKGERDNRFGIGVKAYVFSGGGLQYQQLMLTRGFQSSVAPVLHFGLSKQKQADSLLVVWPNQTYQILKTVKANQRLTIEQKNAAGKFAYNRFFPQAQPIFTEVTAQTGPNWKHQENNFVDFNMQPLIPHMLSAEGPRMAVADVNHDGLEDFYIGGAKGQAGAIFMQNKNGTFKPAAQPAFTADATSEDVDATFLDSNRDGYPDLYVASGGNELPDGSPELADRLYLNDGKGNFKRSASLPALLTNKAAVAVADVNHDGYPDIFVGGAPDARQFGKIPASYLLINDGKGAYKPVIIGNELKYAGLLRSAAFADLNQDGWPDLVVAGEWMPVKVFINQKGKLEPQYNAAMDQLSGWWQRIVLADADGDGKTDIIAGNYGWNSKLKPMAKNPVKLYLSDLDKNGTVDPILTYSLKQQDYTFLGKGEIEKQVPLLKKKFLYYHDFAGKTVQQLFGDSLTDNKPLTATTFTSGIFYNQGKGRFTFKPLPAAAQAAPAFAFAPFNGTQSGILAGGNFWGVLPYEGRYDASWGSVLLSKNNRQYAAASPVTSGFVLRGEVRDIKPIRTATGIIYAVAVNNQPIKFFKLKK
ncbi:VCBS repeat-containing protein [Mucilaginibacter sp.]